METIRRIVGDPDRLVLGVIRDDTQHGAKNLFLGDRHAVLYVDEHRGLHEVARVETIRMTLPARENLTAFFDAFADIRLDALVLLLRHHRSNGSLGIRGIANRKHAHGVAYAPLDVIEPTFR